MHVKRLTKLLQEPHLLSDQDIPELEALVREYPYFYLARMLLAKIAYTKQNHLQQPAIKRAAAYATNLDYFHKFLQNENPLQQFQDENKHVEEKPIYTNHYIEQIINKKPKTCTNSKSIEQFRRIDHVLSKALKYDSVTTELSVKEEDLIDLSSAQNALDYRLATETLAKLLIKQQKYKQAKQIYEYLILKHPEKTIYFTNQINNIPNNC